MNEPNTQPELAELSGERGMPGVNDQRRGKGAKVAFIMAIVLIFLALVALAILKFTRPKPAPEQKVSVEAPALPARSFTAPAAPPTPPAPAEAVSIVPGVDTRAGGPAPSVPGGTSDAEAKPPAKLDKSASSLMVEGGDTGTGGSQDAGQPAQAVGAGGSKPEGSGPLAGLLSGTQTDPRKASMLGNRNFILAKGSFIDCALQTRLDSTVPGMTACVVTRNIFSDNGKVLLIERGSTVTGEYQSNMRQGMARIYVLWTRVKTPNGVVVNLDSPGSDPLGGAGVPGYVNNHFWKRFGGALMLSLVDDVARFATQQGGGSNGDQINFNSTGEATTDMATEALKNTINIPPTLYKNQGEQVGIYIARDLDFSSVYDVQAR
ncbi:type IV secretion system protein VirB10 [Xanthomonas campestris]|uniref:type IV secretion system protein VirB10 n=1 Tax=Xanthomonas campestris TaxID=339 RepID=UPI002378486F|nr:type IV secretion system protein VirB10 [Xanthomonas campestris]WDK04511.1 type IV secretion system protein VirB10 [Xanthomonas campestris]